MTDTTDGDPVAAADAKLRDLEERYIEGDRVKPEQIEAAERESRLARLKRQRAERQAEKRREKQREETINRLTDELAAVLADAERDLPDLYRAAVDANTQLVEAVDRRNGRVRELIRELEGQGAEKIAGRKTVGAVAWLRADLVRLGDSEYPMGGVAGWLAKAALPAIRPHNRNERYHKPSELGEQIAKAADWFKDYVDLTTEENSDG